jgi:hypothetical protein
LAKQNSTFVFCEQNPGTKHDLRNSSVLVERLTAFQVSGTPERTSALSGALSKLNGIRRIDNNRCGVTGCSTPKVQTVQTHDRSLCLSTCLSEGLRINSPYGSCSVRHSRSALIAPLSFLHLDNSTSKIGGVSDRDVD